MIARAAKLERLGLAEQIGPAQWILKPGIEPALRDLGIRGDIIKTMHRALSAADRQPDVAGFALHGDEGSEQVLGRLVERGLHDELKGAAYAIIDGVDGRTHHLVFSDLEMTGDAKAGAVVEVRAYDHAVGASGLNAALRQRNKSTSPRKSRHERSAHSSCGGGRASSSRETGARGDGS
jgi:type IV secretory pathway VirD2 relaxase